MTGPFRILLLEPGYRNKYPPLGLMKLASYHRERGDHVRLVKGEDPSILFEVWSRVYVTTLFSFEWRRTAQAIDFAVQAAGNRPERVFVGGIAASLMHGEFIREPRWASVRFISGLLDGPPAQALQLSAADEDFGIEICRRLLSRNAFPIIGFWRTSITPILFGMPISATPPGAASASAVSAVSRNSKDRKGK